MEDQHSAASELGSSAAPTPPPPPPPPPPPTSPPPSVQQRQQEPTETDDAEDTCSSSSSSSASSECFVSPLEDTSSEDSADTVLPPEPRRDEEEQEEDSPERYMDADVLQRHLRRQSTILRQALQEAGPDAPAEAAAAPSVEELSRRLEAALFSPATPPRRQENGTCAPDPRLNFYPVFMLPEALATYHLFFHNQKIPVSCRANRPRADAHWRLPSGTPLPDYPTTDEVSKIFEGLGDEEPACANQDLKERDSVLVELKLDNPRLAVVKQCIAVTHFAYPALALPPKVMSTLMQTLLVRRASPLPDEGEAPLEDLLVVSDEQLARWMHTSDPKVLEERRKTVTAACMVTVQLHCMHTFLTSREMVRRLGECLHYMFRQGYVKLASKIANMELSNLVSYLGMLHENRLGQHVLHHTLKHEARRDYVRDTIYLYLVYTWQTAMGVWQQCLEDRNLRALETSLARARQSLWTGFDERTIAQDLAAFLFPTKLVETLQRSLPDFASQSMMHAFRSFVLERSGILPAVCNALPSDFVPTVYRECPPPLWAHCYLLRLANFLMYHCDLAEDTSGEGLFECYCRCNLCAPHRCLATNTALLNEVQAINTFELQRPPKPDGTLPPPFKLTPGLWTSAFLRHFVSEDYHSDRILFYEDVSRPPRVEPSACVITHSAILAQLHDIKKAREEFLLTKGHGVYLDPHTGEELNTAAPSTAHHAAPSKEAHPQQHQHQPSRRHHRSSYADRVRSELHAYGGATGSSRDPVSGGCSARGTNSRDAARRRGSQQRDQRQLRRQFAQYPRGTGGGGTGHTDEAIQALLHQQQQQQEHQPAQELRRPQRGS